MVRNFIVLIHKIKHFKLNFRNFYANNKVYRHHSVRNIAVSREKRDDVQYYQYYFCPGVKAVDNGFSREILTHSDVFKHGAHRL